jgi:hypothetical protein
VCVEATGGNVAVGHNVVRKGHGCQVRGPVDITLGEAQLRLSPVDPARPVADVLDLRTFLAHRPRALVFAVTGLILAVSIVVARGVAHPAREATAQGATHVAFTGRAETLNETSEHSASAIEHAKGDLADHLANANIHTLHISTVDGRLAVTGKLNREEAVAWTAIQQWFDQAYADFVLTANVTVGDGRDMPTFQLQAVWYGDQPYVIAGDGERYYQGTILDNGWAIKEVDEDRLLLSKGNETLVVTYR